jgi:hypothetical protein
MSSLSSTAIVLHFRQIDVHYSLPRDDHSARGDRDKNQVRQSFLCLTPLNDRSLKQLQGTLQVTLRNSASGQPIDDNEVRRKFQQFGDVKIVKPVGDRTEFVIHPDIALNRFK